MALREIFVSLGIDLPEEEVAKLEGALGVAKKVAAGIGLAFSAAKLKGWVEETVHDVARVAAETGHMAERLGVDAEQLQVFGKIARRAGVSSEEMGASLRILSRNAYEASKGGKEANESFGAVGVSVVGANGKLKGSSELLVEIADRFAGIDNEMERVALAQKVFGRGGTAMLPILKHGGKALQEQVEKFKALGVTTQHQIELAHELEVAEMDQEDAIKGLKKAFAFELIPVFTDMARKATETIRALKPAAQFLGKVLGAAIEVLRGTFEGLIQVVKLLWDAFAQNPVFNIMLATVGALTAAVAAFGAASVGAALASAGAWVLALLPFILIAAIVVAIMLAIQDMVAGAEDGSSVIFGAFMEMSDGIKKSFDDAIAWIRDKWTEFGDWIAEKAAAFKAFVTFGASPGAAAGNPAGVSTAATGGDAGATVAPTTNVEVHVDASGSTASPAEIGKAVADPVAAHVESQNRQLAQAFAVAR